MPLDRQRLLQRFFNLHHCIATTRAKQKRTATPPRKRLSRPMTSIANGDKRRRASTGANRMTSLRMVTLLTTKNDLAVKTAAIRKIAKRKFPTNAAPGHPRLPRGCPSPPRALQHAQRCPSEKKRCRIDRPSLQMTAFLTTNESALVKTAVICKNSFRSTGDRPNRSPASPSAPSAWSAWSDKFVSPNRTAQQPKSNGSSTQVKRLVGRQSASNGSPARLEQLVSSDQPVPDVRAAHADAH